MNLILAIVLAFQTFVAFGESISIPIDDEQSITLTITKHADGSLTLTVPPPPPPCGPCLSATPASLPSGTAITGTWTGVTNPSSLDWMAIAVPGSTDFEFAAWTYIYPPQVNGTINIYAFVRPGTYELRYFRNGAGRAATSNTFIVQ